MAQSGTRSVLALLGLLLIFLTGCRVESSVPLSPVSEAEIDKVLVGNWADFEKGKPEGEFRVLPFNDHELLIMICDYGKPQESQVNPIRAFTSVIEDERFLNIQWIDEKIAGSRKWIFINYLVRGDELRYRGVAGKLLTGKDLNSREIVEFIKRNLDNKDLYEAYQVLKRVQE